MVGETLVYAIPEELVGSFSGLILMLQALGGVIIVYIVFNIINYILNRKKRNELKEINKNLDDIKQILLNGKVVSRKKSKKK